MKYYIFSRTENKKNCLSSRTLHASRFTLHERGFTLIEVTIVVVLFVLIFAITIGSGSNFYYNQALITERDNVVGILKNARSRALNNTNQASHGVYVSTSTNRYITFDGSSYAARDQNYDLVFPASPGVQLSGPSEIVFTAITGEANTSGTIVISAGAGTASILVNYEGRISW